MEDFLRNKLARSRFCILGLKSASMLLVVLALAPLAMSQSQNSGFLNQGSQPDLNSQSKLLSQMGNIQFTLQDPVPENRTIIQPGPFLQPVPVVEAKRNEAPGPVICLVNLYDEEDNKVSPLPPTNPEDVATPGAGINKTPEKIGQELPKNQNLQFLRRQSVLLDPGDWQLDYGLVYSLFDNDIPVPQLTGPNVTNVIEGHRLDRLVYVPLEYRQGIRENMQAFVNLPIGMSSSQLNVVGDDINSTVGGIGDLTGGLSWMIREGSPTCSPDVIFTSGITAPTGAATDTLSSVVPGTRLGQGYWASSFNLLWLHHFDPLVVYYGIGWRHLYERDINGITVQPGEQFSYQLGVGFAVNEFVTLSTSFTGIYITESYFDSSRIAGTVLEPMSLRFAATVSRGCYLIEPFVTIGMTDSSPDATLGIVYTY